MEAAWRPAGADGRPGPTWMEPFARTIDAAKKYVVSSTLERVDWNAELVCGELGKAVRAAQAGTGQGTVRGRREARAGADGAGADRRVRARGASQARGPRPDVVRGAVKACRLEAREPALDGERRVRRVGRGPPAGRGARRRGARDARLRARGARGAGRARRGRGRAPAGTGHRARDGGGRAAARLRRARGPPRADPRRGLRREGWSPATGIWRGVALPNLPGSRGSVARPPPPLAHGRADELAPGSPAEPRCVRLPRSSRRGRRHHRGDDRLVAPPARAGRRPRAGAGTDPRGVDLGPRARRAVGPRSCSIPGPTPTSGGVSS